MPSGVVQQDLRVLVDRGEPTKDNEHAWRVTPIKVVIGGWHCCQRVRCVVVLHACQRCKWLFVETSAIPQGEILGLVSHLHIHPCVGGDERHHCITQTKQFCIVGGVRDLERSLDLLQCWY